MLRRRLSTSSSCKNGGFETFPTDPVPLQPPTSSSCKNGGFETFPTDPVPLRTYPYSLKDTNDTNHSFRPMPCLREISNTGVICKIRALPRAGTPSQGEYLGDVVRIGLHEFGVHSRQACVASVSVPEDVTCCGLHSETTILWATRNQGHPLCTNGTLLSANLPRYCFLIFRFVA